MSLNLAEKFKELQLVRSPSFPLIMHKYDQIGKHMSVRAFWLMHVKELDPTITYRKWSFFIAKLEAVQKIYVEKAIAKSNETALSEAKLEKNSMMNVLKIADITFQSIMDNPALLEAVPLKERANWLFRAMKARDSRSRTSLALRADERDQSFYEKMMEGAQYGGINPDEIPDAEFTEVETKTNEQQEQSVPLGLPADHAESAI